MRPQTKERISTWGTHVIHICLGLTVLCGCVLEPRPDHMAAYTSWHSLGDRDSMTDVEPAQTSRTALFRLARELDHAYERFDVSPPHPKIRIVGADHSVLKDGAIAVAAVTDHGEERIYFNRRHLNANYSIASTIRHEVAHLAAWRQHGVKIAPHGPEFKAICWAATSRADCSAQQAPMVGRR